MDWIQLPEGVIGFFPPKIHILSKRVRKVQNDQVKEYEICRAAEHVARMGRRGIYI
jgi:hypothetical protein